MYQFKNILGFIATLLVFIGYVPYIRDLLKGKTKPHLYSWFLWTLVTAIAFGLQFTGGAGSGSYVTLAASLMCLAILIIGFTQKNKIVIVPIDTVFLVLAFLALALWLIAKQPILSAILATAIDLFGFAPTVRKTWNNPYTETLSFYLLNTFRFALAVVALQTYTIVTAIYPIAWMFGNGLFAMMLVIRRRVRAV